MVRDFSFKIRIANGKDQKINRNRPPVMPDHKQKQRSQPHA